MDFTRLGRILGFSLPVAVIALAGFFEITSPDLYWHLRTGIDLWRGLTPFVDHYSFTFNGSPIYLTPWLFQAVLSAFYQMAGGLVGVDILRIVIWLAALALLQQHFHRSGASIGARAIGVGFYLLAVVHHSEPRPELMSYVFELIILKLILDWHERPLWPTALKISGLLVLWTNWHFSSVMGFAIAGAFAAEKVLDAGLAKDRKFFGVLAQSVAMGAAGFLNPGFTHPLLRSVAFDPRWAKYISEFHGLDFVAEGPLFYIYLFLIAWTLADLLRRKRIGPAILLLLLAIKTISMPRLFPHLAVISLPFVVPALDLLGAKLNRRVAMAAALAGVLGLSGAILRILVLHPYHPSPLQLSSSRYFPVATVEYIKEKHLSGRIFNEYAEGGFLIFALSPQMQVFIDGRTNVLYPIDFTELYENAISDVNLFKQQAEKYRFDYVLADLDRADEIMDIALDSGLFNIAYMSRRDILLTHETGAFPVLSRLFTHPECLEQSDAAQIHMEEETAAAFAEGAPARAYLHFAAAYLKAEDPRALFQTPDLNLLASPQTTRLAARLAEKAGADQAALFYYARLTRPSQEDKIRRATLDCKIHACEEAEKILDSITAPGLNDGQRLRAYLLLQAINRRRPLQVFTEARIERLRVKIQAYLEPGAKPAPLEKCRPPMKISGRSAPASSPAPAGN